MPKPTFRPHISYKRIFEPSVDGTEAKAGGTGKKILPPLETVLREIHDAHPHIMNNGRIDALYVYYQIKRSSEILCIDTLEKLKKFKKILLDCIAEFDKEDNLLFLYIMWRLHTPFKFVHRIKRSTSLPTVFRLVDKKVC